jgi:putative phosphoribosyl transferase
MPPIHSSTDTRALVRNVRIPPVGLEGVLDLPARCCGIVAFAHGSGSSRLSPRNTHVAAALRESGLGTLLFDLLTASEAQDRRNVFDIGLLADRLLQATRWLRREDAARMLPIGYFGASTGAAAALVAAAEPGNDVDAVVSRGGRPDLADAVLERVRAPTLLIVGGYDVDVLNLNRLAYARLQCEKAIAVVEGATHLFEEPGTLDAVVDHARRWFTKHFGPLAHG